MSQIKVDSIIPRGGLPSGAKGGITQTVQTFKADGFSFTTSGQANFVAITGLTVTITPQNSSNDVLISGFVTFNMNNASMNVLRLKRGTTVVGVGTAGNPTKGISAGTSNADRYHPYPFQFLDSPNTTSATTYSLEMSKSQSGTMRINRRDNSTSSGFTACSSITAQEVSG